MLKQEATFQSKAVLAITVITPVHNTNLVNPKLQTKDGTRRQV